MQLGEPIDTLAQPVAAVAPDNAGRPFAVFDIDGTVIRWQLYHAIVDELARQGHIAAEIHQQIRDARMTWKSRRHSGSFSDYEQTLVDAYHAALTDLPVDAYIAAVDHVFETYKDQVYTFTRDLIHDLKEQGYWLFIISGSQQEVIQKLGDYYGFDDVVGTRYEQQAGRFTGQREGVIQRKADILQQLIDKYELSLAGSIAVGDTGSDIAMLEMVEQPIAFNPNHQLFDHARQSGWRVVIERKNMIYNLEPHDGSYLLAKTND